jgi:hypothetical protein
MDKKKILLALSVTALLVGQPAVSIALAQQAPRKADWSAHHCDTGAMDSEDYQPNSDIVWCFSHVRHIGYEPPYGHPPRPGLGFVDAPSRFRQQNCDQFPDYVSAGRMYERAMKAMKARQYILANGLVNSGLNQIDSFRKRSGKGVGHFIDDSYAVIRDIEQSERKGLPLRDVASVKAGVLQERLYIYGNGFICGRGEFEAK